MLPGVRWFVLIIFILVAGTVVLPLLSPNRAPVVSQLTTVETLQARNGQTSEQSITLNQLGYQLNLRPDTVRLIGAMLVLAVLYIGLKFISVGGAHH